MTSVAIPSVPPPAVTSSDGAAPPADADSRFGDALRESKAQPKASDDGHRSDPGTRSSPRKDADTDLAKPDEKAGAKDTVVLAGMMPSVPVSAVPVRQSPAATGKPLPPAASPAGIQSAVSQPKSLDRVRVGARAPLLNTGRQAVVDTRGDNAPIAGNVARTRASTANISGLDHQVAGAPVAHASGSDAPTAQTVGTQPVESPAPDADIAAVPGTSDLDANPPAVDRRGDAKALPNSGPNTFAAQLVQLAGMHAGTAPAQPPPPPVQLAMQSAPGQPQFAQEAAQHVSWLAGQKIQQAEIQLNPKKLGPIQVEITTHHDRVDVSFAVQHPQTVHALQQTLPQLHDMLAQQGLNLGHASVGHQAPGRQHPAFAQHPGAGGGGHHSGGAEVDASPNWRPLRIATPGRVDDFA
jgi:flagellar hook-length control protein FliK